MFVAGAALALGPKRLGLTVLVAATISAADLGAVEATVLSRRSTSSIATALVTMPVVLSIVFGTRAERMDDRC